MEKIKQSNKKYKTPEEKLFKFLESLPEIDADKAWKEVEEERKKEHR